MSHAEVFPNGANGANLAQAGRNLLVKAQPGRVIADITPRSAGWRHVGFKALRLDAGEAEAFATGTRELCITVLSGQLDVLVGNQRYSALGSSGHSSSYPPHKHDSAGTDETALEETYYHQLNPPQGFAFQRVYTDDRSLDEAMAVEHRDTVMVPRGYHPCAVPYGYDLYYLNTMAGPERRWAFKNDPAHEWMLVPR